MPEAGRQSGISVPYSKCQLLVGKYEYPPEGEEAEPKLKKYAPFICMAEAC